MEETHKKDVISLDRYKKELISSDPYLERLFREVDDKNTDIFQSQKKPFPSLIGAIIGQRISFYSARKMRGDLYSKIGTDFTPKDVLELDLAFLGNKEDVVRRVCVYIINNNVSLETEEDIISLRCVKGIGRWTTDTTILTCMLYLDSGYDIFPYGDKFIEKRLIRLYGKSINVEEHSEKWSPYRSIVTWYFWRWF